MNDAPWIYWLDVWRGSVDMSTKPTNETTSGNEHESTDLAVLGGKGANLKRLMHMGFPVPLGFVITTAAYQKFIASDDLTALEAADPTSFRQRITQAPIPGELSAAILAAYRRLGGGPVAVRSSGTAEDLAAASFAGQHDTFLDVSGSEPLLNGVRACWASLWTPRAIAYRRQHISDDRAGDAPDAGDRAGGAAGDAMPLALAVVVQVMVPAEAAGVAFTANPVTGNRGETTISAVHGLGERLVSGESVADEWVVRGSGVEAGVATAADCQRGVESVLTAEQALAVANLARRIERAFGAPQDVEWAIAGSTLFVLQARPMTALPEWAESAAGLPAEPAEPAETEDLANWTSPLPGGWMRNFRLGEWLPEPVTPLCDSWLLPRIEAAEFATQACFTGVHPRPPYHVSVNGWYFSSPIGAGVSLRGVVRALLRHPRRILALPLSLIRPELAERTLLLPLTDRWRTELLPRYQRLVTVWQSHVATASPAELTQMIDAIADVAGDYFWVFSVVGGHAWKVERALARLYQRRLVARVRRSHQELLRGLPTPFPEPPAHAVQSLDWMRPTLGEDKAAVMVARRAAETGSGLGSLRLRAAQARHRRLEEERHSAEQACRQALTGQPRLLRRFDALLALAQRYAVIREEQAGWFTLGWPLLRTAVLRLGEELRLREAMERAEDVFFLTRTEVEACLGLAPGHGPSTVELRTGAEAEAEAEAPDLRAVVAVRRREWERQRRLSPPLALGKPPGESLIARAVEVMRVPGAANQDAPGALNASSARDSVTDLATLRGMPASPGRAAGMVRVIRSPDDFVRFQSGEVLVAQLTAPAWTPLFERAAAVVTDSGSVAAHASLVAREYGIPAVVGTGDATTRLHDGQWVIVDGSAGVVQVHAHAPA